MYQTWKSLSAECPLWVELSVQGHLPLQWVGGASTWASNQQPFCCVALESNVDKTLNAERGGRLSRRLFLSFIAQQLLCLKRSYVQRNGRLMLSTWDWNAGRCLCASLLPHLLKLARRRPWRAVSSSELWSECKMESQELLSSVPSFSSVALHKLHLLCSLWLFSLLPICKLSSVCYTSFWLLLRITVILWFFPKPLLTI